MSIAVGMMGLALHAKQDILLRQGNACQSTIAAQIAQQHHSVSATSVARSAAN